MTDPGFTHLAMLLDRSGSMSRIRQATCEGFDAFVSQQREQPGRCTLTLAQFDDRYDEVHRDTAIADVPPLDLSPRGSTALLDAIARLVHTTGERLAALAEAERPGTVVVGIMTDGHENASREWTHPAIKELINAQEERYDWSFLYLGANQDAIEVGSRIGVAAERSMTYSSAGTSAALGATSALVAEMRAMRASGVPAAARRKAGYTRQQREDAAE